MNNNMEVIFLGPNGNNPQLSRHREATADTQYPPNKYSSCKTLQRKLELKVERAKRNYSQTGGEVFQVRHLHFDTLFSFIFFHIKLSQIHSINDMVLKCQYKGYKKQ